jgi:HK97 family phage prohead protease
MDKQYKSFPITAVKAVDNAAEGEGTISAVVSVFNNVDYGNEVVRAGAFSKSLERKLPKGVWMHDWSQPVAKTVEARELLPGDPLLPEAIRQLGGLYIKGQFNTGTQRGREAYSDVKFGIVDEFSIGYTVERQRFDEEQGVTELLELNLAEWSPVLVGMNPLTALTSIKANLGALEDGAPYGEHLEAVANAVEGLVARTKARQESREKVGRELSAANVTTLKQMRDALTAVIPMLDELLARAEPKAATGEIMNEFGRYLQMQSRIRELTRSLRE